ncbi:Dynein 18 kDa light chain [Diplonema papillatum]|nr:Dynein 18 kDa light chain [Diplonema papillatum]
MPDGSERISRRRCHVRKRLERTVATYIAVMRAVSMLKRRTRLALHGREVAAIKAAYHATPCVNSRPAILDLLRTLGQSVGEAELEELLDLSLYKNDSTMAIERFLRLMEVLKRRDLDEAVPDTVEAFAALGGRKDKQGGVDVNVLRLTVKAFHLTIDIEKMIQEVDTDGSGFIDFDEFSAMFDIGEPSTSKNEAGSGGSHTPADGSDQASHAGEGREAGGSSAAGRRKSLFGFDGAELAGGAAGAGGSADRRGNDRRRSIHDAAQLKAALDGFTAQAAPDSAGLAQLLAARLHRITPVPFPSAHALLATGGPAAAPPPQQQQQQGQQPASSADLPAPPRSPAQRRRSRAARRANLPSRPKPQAPRQQHSRNVVYIGKTQAPPASGPPQAPASAPAASTRKALRTPPPSRLASSPPPPLPLPLPPPPSSSRAASPGPGGETRAALSPPPVSSRRTLLSKQPPQARLLSPAAAAAGAARGSHSVARRPVDVLAETPTFLASPRDLRCIKDKYRAATRRIFGELGLRSASEAPAAVVRNDNLAGVAQLALAGIQRHAQLRGEAADALMRGVARPARAAVALRRELQDPFIMAVEQFASGCGASRIPLQSENLLFPP